jgi:colicin import membrane protein
MRTGLTISCAGHAAVLLWSALALVMRPSHLDSTEALPIDVISASEFSQMTNGAKNAPQAEKPKPVVDKVADATPPVADPTAKIAKKEIKAATDVPPVPEPKPPEPKAKKQPPAPADPIADALKKDEDKKPEPKRADTPTPTPPKKPPQREPAPQFDPRQVAALLDKRTSQRVASAGGEIPNKIPGFGDAGAAAGQLSQSETGALRARLEQLWNVPAGVKDPRELTLDVEIMLNPDGTLASAPIVLTSGNSPMFVAAKDSAVRAVYRGQPYTMLRPEHYELWKDIVVTFDPQHVLGN